MATNPAYRLPALLEGAVQHVKQAARAAVERTVESLGLSALSSNNVFQRDNLLAAQFELNRRSAIFILTFDEAFDSRVLRECAPRSAPDADRSAWDELSLVEHHELEIKVAAERFGLEIAHACEWELRELEGYLGSVLGANRNDPAAPRNPLRPEVIGLAMIRGAEAVADRDDVRKALVAELGRSLAAALGATYQAIVADLRGAGVQPAGLSVRTAHAPEGRRSESGVDNFALVDTFASTGSRFMNTFSKPTTTWKCFP